VLSHFGQQMRKLRLLRRHLLQPGLHLRNDEVFRLESRLYVEDNAEALQQVVHGLHPLRDDVGDRRLRLLPTS
jgi:hypothetical protein